MEKKYEAPKFEFEEMRLFEKVADKCWGYAYAWFDADNDGAIDQYEKVQLSTLGLGSNGCQGANARTELTKLWGKIEGVNADDLEKAVSTNNNSPLVKKYNS